MNAIRSSRPRQISGRSLITPLAVAVLILAAAAPGNATQARLRTLGDGAAYLEDDSNVLFWFASLIDYPDQIVLDLGHLDHDAGGSLNRSLVGPAGGLHARLDQAGRWGSVGLYIQEMLPAGAPGGAITLLGARSFGTFSFGAKAMFSSHFEGSNATDFYGHGEGLYFHVFGLASRLDLADGLYGDIAGEIVNTQSDAIEEDLWHLPAQQTSTSWSARTRWFLGLNEKAALVPVFGHRRDDRQVFAAALDAPADRRARRTAVGLGLNLIPDPDNLVVVSSELCWGREQHDRLPEQAVFYEYDRSDFAYKEVHARVGLETVVLPWLTVRGALQYWRLQHEHDRWRGGGGLGPVDRWREDRSITVLTPITLGVGLHAGPFQADLVFNARWVETYGTFPFGPQEAARGTYTGINLGYRF
jgi:hypothetical protein